MYKFKKYLLKLLIVASGGGHTGFARAIAEYLPFKADFVVPRGDSWSMEVLKDYASNVYEVMKGRGPKDGMSVLLRNSIKSFRDSFSLNKYDVVIATGSNHSLFVALSQKLKGSTIFSIESQDRIVTRGKAVSIMSKFSKNVFVHWKEQKSLYKNSYVVGPIVEKPKFSAKNEGYVLVTAGTMGFPRLFKEVSKLDKFNFIVQTGQVDPSTVKASKAFKFDSEMERLIAGASVVVTHQGKTAMESVVMYGKPTVIVYNSDLTKAATKEDTKLYAEILGAKFLDDPLTWKGGELEKALDNPNKPKNHEIGTPKLIDYILKYKY
jgi:UDP-N-acetylglucosamine:LPS N-acetylglucosamine transferase